MRLLESNARPARGRGGMVVSVTAHAAIIVLAVVATGDAKLSHDPPKAVETIYVAAPPPPPPIGTTAARNRTTDRSTGVTNSALGLPLTNFTTLPDIVLPSAPSAAQSIDPAQGLFAEGAGLDRGGSGSGGELSAASPLAAGEVDRQVVLAGAPPRPRYPDALRAAGVAGRVVVRFVVDTVGRVELPTVAIAAATHPLFADAAERTLAGLRFRPAEARGRRVRQLVELPFDFTIEGTRR